MRVVQRSSMVLLLLIIVFVLTSCVNLAASDSEVLVVLGFVDSPDKLVSSDIVSISVNSSDILFGTVTKAGWDNGDSSNLYARSTLVATAPLGSSVNFATETAGNNLELGSESGLVIVPLTHVGALGDNYDALANIEAVKSALQADLDAAFPQTAPSSLTFTVGINNNDTLSITSHPMLTATAVANPGYRFASWKENDDVVSTDEAYIFEVTENRNLFAHFEQILILSLDRSELSLIAGGTAATLVATVGPETASNTNVLWTSSDETIVTVDVNGVVTPLSAGTSTITATSEADASVFAVCEVTVTAATVPVTDVTLDAQTLSLVAGGPTDTLTAVITPADATNKNVLWTSSDETIATVDANGVVTPLSAGTSTITATSEADASAFAVCEVTVTAATVPVTGVTLDAQILSLVAGGSTDKLTAVITPADATNKNMLWASSDETIVTVDANGVVTPVDAGTAVITVTTEDGEYTATATVTVDAAQVVSPPEQEPELPRTGGLPLELMAGLLIYMGAYMAKKEH